MQKIKNIVSLNRFGVIFVLVGTVVVGSCTHISTQDPPEPPIPLEGVFPSVKY